MNRLKLSDNKKIAGVCGGLGEYFDIDPTVVRAIFLIAVLCLGFGLLPYIVLWLILPSR